MKLYWRYKKDGKWSWKPATKDDFRIGRFKAMVEEEE